MSDGRSIDHLDPRTKRAILARLANGYKLRFICAEFRVSSSQIMAVQAWARRLHALQSEVAEQEERQAPYLPTPEQIAEACASIQAGWSARERRWRLCLPDERVETPTIRDGYTRRTFHGGTL